jgi:hypothetical protein
MRPLVHLHQTDVERVVHAGDAVEELARNIDDSLCACLVTPRHLAHCSSVVQSY